MREPFSFMPPSSQPRRPSQCYGQRHPGVVYPDLDVHDSKVLQLRQQTLYIGAKEYLLYDRPG